MPDLEALTQVARQRIQDSAIRAARLLAQHKDELEHLALLVNDLHDLREPVTVDQLTPRERHDLLMAAQVTVNILDEGQDG